MDFTPLEKDMNIISALDDEPNDVGGLTATELKAKFDEGGNAIKDYLNNTVIPEVKVALGDKAGKDELQGLVLGQIPDGTITEDKLSEELKEQIGSMAPLPMCSRKKRRSALRRRHYMSWMIRRLRMMCLSFWHWEPGNTAMASRSNTQMGHRRRGCQ